MIRFALIVASTLGFVLTAALGNLMTPLLRAFRVQQEENEPPTMGGLCLMVGTLAAVGVGWTAACVAQPELLGTESLLTTRLLIALFGALCFGAVGLADDVVRLRHRSPLGLRRPVRLALEAASGTLVLALLGLNHCLPDGLALPGVGYCTLGPLAPVVWLAILVALAESARTADGMDGTVCGCAFIAMLGLMTAMTLLGWFPLGVLPADGQLIAPHLDLDRVAHRRDFLQRYFCSGNQPHIQKPQAQRPLAAHLRNHAGLADRQVINGHLSIPPGNQFAQLFLSALSYTIFLQFAIFPAPSSGKKYPPKMAAKERPHA